MPSQDGARGIHTAAMKGHVSVINTLLNKGENVDATTNVRYTYETIDFIIDLGLGLGFTSPQVPYVLYYSINRL